MRGFGNSFRDGLYRSREGFVLGVCKGVASYFDFSVFWTRAIALILLFFSGFWPMIALYFIAGFIMKPEPAIPIQTDDQQEFYESYIHSKIGALNRIKRRYDHLEQRIRRLEHAVTDREFQWEQRLNT